MFIPGTSVILLPALGVGDRVGGGKGGNCHFAVFRP